jgi:HK97 family phage prohead protease
VKDVIGEEPVMDFIASDETLDRYNEVISVDGWNLANFRSNPVIPDCHDYSSIGKILGKARSISVADSPGGRPQLVNRVEFCTDNPMGLLAYKMAKGGFIKSQSVGFIPLEWTNGSGKDEPSRKYTKQELLEVSLVVVPANPGATIGLALKSGAIDRKDLKELAEFLKQFCSETEPGAQVGASGAGIHDAQLLKLARSLGKVLGRAT